MSKLKAAEEMLARCEMVYGGVLSPSTDISSSDNTVPVYAVADNQLKYVHMYFAKYVGCWVTIRSRLGPQLPAHVTSIGAGPGLCAMGWFWNDPTLGVANVLNMYDALTWDAIRSLPEWQNLFSLVFAGTATYSGGHYAPGNTAIPPQLHGLAAKPLSVETVGDRGVVLLPFLMNHLLGRDRPISDPGERRSLFGWIEDVRSRNLVVIADMRVQRNTHWFWNQISNGLGAPDADENLNFGAAVDEVALAYGVHQRRRRAGPGWFREAGVLVGDRSGWQWLT